MMTAKEARKVSESTCIRFEEQLLKELLCKAERIIEEAALIGKTCCRVNVTCYTNYVVGEAVKSLKHFGYECDIFYESLNSYLKIKW